MKLFLASELYNTFDSFLPYLGDLKDKRVLLIETAAIGENFSANPVTSVKPFVDHGAIVKIYDLREKTKEDVRAELAKTDIVYAFMGNSFFLMKYMKDCGFEELLKERLEQGMIYMGSSAGSIVASPDIAFIAPMDDPDVVDLDDTKGLGLVDFSFVPHLGHEFQGAAAQEIADLHKGPEQMFVLNDNQALYVEGKKVLVL